MGGHELRAIASHTDVEIVAICDVDGEAIAEAAADIPDARRYADWRALLDAEHDAIDSVNVTTPDHMHAPIAMTAVARGKHVFCQKPLTRTVVEARRLTEAAARARVVTQVGIQNRANEPFRAARRVFRDGVTGPVREVHVWTDRPAGWWPQGVPRPEGADPAPAHLDWDGWLGVAPERPYKEGAYHPFVWRGRKDFGTGAQGDMACHLMDPAPWFLGLGAPLSVRSVGPAPTEDSFPEWSTVHYRFAGTPFTVAEGVDVTWYDGGRRPDALLAALGAGEDVYANAALFVGEEAALLVSPYEPCRLLTRDGERELTLPQPGAIDHWHEYVDACLGRGEASADFRYAGPLTEIALLGNVALHAPGETLHWHAASLSLRGRHPANAWLHAPYRPGWEVEGL